MPFLNETGIIGTIIKQGTETATGNLFLTLLILVILVLAVALMFGIQLEFTIIIVFPLLISCMAYYSEFVTVGVVMMLYIAFIVSKRFILGG
jgi:type IV secretory pathway VirB2 component (pilin)